MADLQAILARAGLPTIPGLGPDGRKAIEGSEWGQGRGVTTRRGGAGTTQGVGSGGGTSGRAGGRGGTRGVRRSRSRKFRAFEDEMGTRITKVVRGFLERRRYEIRWAVWDEERRRAGASLIQRTFRSYRKRMGWHLLESGVMDRAATKVQARWRGMSCRMALTRRREENALWNRRNVSAITIQTAARRRCMVARYGPRLSLRIARRKREAHAAAEARRPRRRWNRRGAPGASGDADPRASMAGPGASRRLSISVLASGATGFQPGRKGPRRSVWAPVGDVGVQDSVSGHAAAAREVLRKKEGGVKTEMPQARGGVGPSHPTVDLAASRDARKDYRSGVGVSGTNSSITSGLLPGMEKRQSKEPAAAAAIPLSAPLKQEHTGKGEKRGSRGGSTSNINNNDNNNNSHAEVTATATNNATATATATSSHSKPPNATTGSGAEARLEGVRFAAETGNSPSEIGRLASERVSLLFVEESVQAAVLRSAARGTSAAAESTGGVPGSVLEGAAAATAAAAAAAAAVGVLPAGSPLPGVRGASAVAVAADL